MKKLLSIIITFLIFILIYFLQVNFFSWFNIAGIKPNLFIILVMLIGLSIGKIYGLSIGIVFGLFLDIFVGKAIGVNAFFLGIAGFLRWNIYQKFFKR